MIERGELTQERITNMRAHAEKVIATLAIKNPKYGESWKSHGGFSAFFNTQRKWSRIENLASKHNYDIFQAMAATQSEPDGMAETIWDLIGYLLLILDDQVALSSKEQPYIICTKAFLECRDPNCFTHGRRAVSGGSLELPGSVR